MSSLKIKGRNMLVLNTLSNNKIWGTSRMHNYAGDKSIDTVGSVYSASGIEELSCEILYGDESKDLYSAIKKNPKRFGLSEGVDYPIIVSFTGADEDLSIQVHPTDEYAKEKENKLVGKSESWYFIEEPDEGYIYAESLLEDKEKIKELILEGKYEKVVDKKRVKKGDIVYIESGTLHALAKGALVYEIQQSTDITYRFYDFDRVDNEGNKRDLHLEDALNTLKTENRVNISKFNINIEKDSKPYKLLRTKLSEKYTNNEKIAQTITVIKGDMIADGYNIKQGMSIMVLPGEEINISNQTGEVIIATPKLYFEV